MVNIKTGADRLIDLISDKKKISLDAAAKNLGVGKDVVQEWAEFLEEEGLITIDYSFSQIWLYEKRITKEDVLENAREIDSQRVALARKIDAVLGSLNQDTAGFDEVKKHFTDMQSHIKNELDTVRKQLGELEKYNELKKNLDKDLDQQKSNYEAMIKKISADLREEERKYFTLTNQIEVERKTVDTVQGKIDSLKKTKDDLEKNIFALRDYLKTVDKTIMDYKTIIDLSSKKIYDMKSDLNNIEKEIKGRKSKEIEEVLLQVQKQMNEFIKKQEEISSKIKEKTSQMGNYSDIDKKIQENFQGFFTKNIELEKLMAAIEADKNELTKNLEAMKDKVLTFSLMSKSKDVMGQLDQIESELRKVETKRSSIKQKIEKLFSTIKGQ